MQHRQLRTTLEAGAATVLVGVLVASCGSQAPQASQPSQSSGIPQPVSVTSAEMKQLPRATTRSKVKAAPRDPRPKQRTDGTVVKIKKPQVVYARPGGKPIAVLPAKQLGGPSWVPVIRTSPGWKRVLLPSRPNHSTGWLYSKGQGIKEFHSSSLVTVDLSERKLSIAKGGKKVGTWTVAVGKPGTPTPTGRTFVLALLAPPKPTYSPLVLPLGAHSNTLKTYGGGPGTVGFHFWKDSSVFGKAVTHGCVRVPKPALQALGEVPLGSQVLIHK